MAGAFVQDWWFSVLNGTTCNVIVSGATANNLLVANVTHNASESVGSVAGWTALAEDITGPTSASFWRIATGDSNDDFLPSWTNPHRVLASVSEYSGLATTGQPDSAITSNFVSGTSISAGSVTPGSQPGLCISILGSARWDQWDTTGPSVNSGFSINSARDITKGPWPGVWVASLNYTTTSALNPVWSTTDSGGGTVAVNVCFKAAAGGATTFSSLSIISALMSGGAAKQSSANSASFIQVLNEGAGSKSVSVGSASRVGVVSAGIAGPSGVLLASSSSVLALRGAGAYTKLIDVQSASNVIPIAVGAASKSVVFGSVSALQAATAVLAGKVMVYGSAGRLTPIAAGVALAMGPLAPIAYMTVKGRLSQLECVAVLRDLQVEALARALEVIG